MPRTRIALSTGAFLLAAATLAATPPRAPRAEFVAHTGPDSISKLADAGRIQGSPSAKVWLIEASDFQCPYCKEWHDGSYDAIMKEYVATGKVRFAFLNDPLPIHSHSVQAAEAAMCASAQGKFWPMHQELFATQAKWDSPADPASLFESLAVKAGVNAAQWKICVSTHATLALIQADQARLRASGVQSTPTFFIGGETLVGAAPTATFRGALDSALARAGKP